MEKDNFTYNPETHQYILNGEQLPGVSSILRSAGFNDMSMIRQDVLERAQEFGEAVHKMCEFYDKGTLDDKSLDNNLMPYLNGWCKFLALYSVTFIWVEKIVYSKKWKYAGTLDRIADLNWKGERVLALLDLKSTTTMNPSVALQTAGYKLMYEEMTKQKTEVRLGVQLLPDDFKVIPYDDKTDERTFLACLQIRNWKKNRGIK